MIKRMMAEIGIIIGLLLAQSAWLEPIAIFGVIPDLALLALIWSAYKNGSAEGTAIGFATGLVEDAISLAPLGFNAFIKTTIAWFSGLLHGSFFIDRLVLPAVMGFGGTVCKALLSMLLAALFKDGVRPYELLDSVTWIEAAYNAVLAPPLFLFMHLIARILVRRDSSE